MNPWLIDDTVLTRSLYSGQRALGGPGSGNFGHAGRPGEVGGSTSFGADNGTPSNPSDSVNIDTAEEGGVWYVMHWSDDKQRQFTETRHAYFTPNAEADFHNIQDASGALIRGVLTLHNPKVLPSNVMTDLGYAEGRPLMERLIREGYDGAISDENGWEIVAFNPKSAFKETDRQIDPFKSLAVKEGPLHKVADKLTKRIKVSIKYALASARLKSGSRDPEKIAAAFSKALEKVLSKSLLATLIAGGTLTMDRLQQLKAAGGQGSGNFGHGGRPGEVGGSSASQINTPEFKAWFGRSKVVDASGKPLVMYHGSNVDIQEFRPFSHFGTADAANERADTLRKFSEDVVHRDPGQFAITPVYLSVQHPLRMPDLASIDSETGEPLPDNWDDAGPGDEIRYPRGWEGEDAIATTLLEQGVIDIDEFEEHRSNQKALELLEEKGYDGIVYRNVVEDAGSDSWIVFRPEQVKSAIANKGAFSKSSKLIAAGGEGSGNFGHAGRPGEVGGSAADGSGSGASEHETKLQAESRKGIEAIQSILDNNKESVLESAGEVLVTETAVGWDDLTPDAQSNAYHKFADDAMESGNIDVDTSDIENEITKELRDDNEDIIKDAEKQFTEELQKTFPIAGPTLTDVASGESVFDKQYQQIDPTTLSLHDTDGNGATVGDDDGDGAPLENLDRLRFRDGSALSEKEQQAVADAWWNAYNKSFNRAQEHAFESDDYYSRRDELERDALDSEWKNLSDTEKMKYVADDDRETTSVRIELPEHWAYDADKSSVQDYARTRAVANELTIRRTMELLEQRKLLESPLASGSSLATIRTIAELQQEVWDSWKASSTSEKGKLLQLAAARELGGVTRFSPDEIKRLEDNFGHLAIGDGVQQMQAYVRANWETTQFILSKAGVDRMQTYRAVGISQSTIETATQEFYDRYGARTADYESGGRTRLTDISIKRNGAASTTLTRDIANTWTTPEERVVVRFDVPRTAVLSIPVYGKNEAGEKEVVLVGTRGDWKWDAWIRYAPDFSEVPIGGRPLPMKKAA